jgi:hypothetical protein
MSDKVEVVIIPPTPVDIVTAADILPTTLNMFLILLYFFKMSFRLFTSASNCVLISFIRSDLNSIYILVFQAIVFFVAE